MEPDTTRKTVAARLADWMANTPHLETQVKVAAKTGLSQATIARILGCKVSATIDNLAAIAAAFGRDAGELISGSDGIQYDRERVARLPLAEQEKISSFISFILASWDSSQSGLNFEEIEVAASIERQRNIQQSANRAPHPTRTLTHHEESAGGGRQRRPTRVKAV